MVLAEQLIFDLPMRTALGRDAFFVSTSNALAVARLDDWQVWPDKRMVLCGPKSAGKTHLAHVWAMESDARILEAETLTASDVKGVSTGQNIVVEHVDRIAGKAEPEELLFHLYNALTFNGGTLLLTGQHAPSRWNVELPDLKSRLMSMEVVALETPDDALLSMLLVKLFRDRQIVVDVDLISYLVARMERSALAAQQLVEALDAASLKQKKAVTKRLASSIL